MSTANQIPSMTGKRILITGGLGFIGSNLAHTCLDLGARVTIYDCLDPRSGGNMHNVSDIMRSVDICRHDIQDFSHLSETLVDKDIVFNCAASTSHPFSMKEPWTDLDVNCRGAINILEALRRFNTDATFIHVGTSTQLGKTRYQPADENHPEFPADIYSANKSVSEKYVLIYANAHGLKASVVRLSNVFGPRACISSADFTFNNYFIGLALQGKKIQVFGEGKQRRNVVYVEDAVSALVMASQSDEIKGEVLFAVGDDHYSVADIARVTVECIGSGSVEFVPWPHERKVVEFGDAIISNAKIKRMLGWSPRFDLRSGLARTKEYFGSCLDKYL